MYLEHLPREVSRWHPNQMLEPPLVSPLNGKEQQFYSELQLDDRDLHLILQGEASPPSEEAHFITAVGYSGISSSLLHLGQGFTPNSVDNPPASC